MVTFTRFPHVLHWTTPAGESTEDPGTGYTIPGAPGENKQTPCRYEMDSSKEFKNEDNTTTQQKGKIFIPDGSEYPSRGSNVRVEPNMFAGQIRDIYTGKLGIKLEV
jgi:hypothetical protein